MFRNIQTGQDFGRQVARFLNVLAVMEAFTLEKLNRQHPIAELAGSDQHHSTYRQKPACFAKLDHTSPKKVDEDAFPPQASSSFLRLGRCAWG
jgi:hypothetical protein